MKKIFIILFIISCFFYENRVFGKNIQTAENKEIIEKANQFFLNLSTFQSNFIQYNDFDGTMAEGIFYISKPEKLRFEYTNPFKNLLITNGKITTFYDIDLDEISNIPTSKTPLFFLLQNNQMLETTDTKIRSIEKESDNITIKTETKLDENTYFIEYIFDKKIENLLGINFSSDNEKIINLTFLKSKKNIELKKDLFIFKNPRLYKKRK